MARVIITIEDVDSESGGRLKLVTKFNPPLPPEGKPDNEFTTAEVAVFKMLEVFESHATHVGDLEEGEDEPAN